MKRLQELEKRIKYHKALYYEGRPEITDLAYDQMEEELRALDPSSAVLNLVGHLKKGSPKIKHKSKMLSLNKTYKASELESWIDDKEVVSTFKVDGVSCSLIYDAGALQLGKTRGDGSFGEDVTSKVSWVDSVLPKVSAKGFVEVRGELYCTQEDFFHLAQRMQDLGLERPSSQRNIVAGLMGRKDNVSLAKYLRFMAFDVLSDDLGLKSEVAKLDWLQKEGFVTPEYSLHQEMKTVEREIEKTKTFMSEGDYLIDGLVFTYNDLLLHSELGSTAHHPRFKMAFKFMGEAKQTKILEILWSVSRNGVLTPVASVSPVELAGAVISRVTLHNFGMVRQFKLKAGDEIKIIRSGEVIPKFIELLKSSSNKWEVPTQCPSCREKVSEQDIRLVCTNASCPAQVVERILNFVQKIGIDDLSTKRLEEMIKVGLVKDIPDLYSLTVKKLLTLDKTKEKLATKLYESIQASKDIDLTSFLGALGISGGAYNKCAKIVDSGFDSMEKIFGLTVESLSEVESFAEKSSQEFIQSLKSKKSLVNKLLKKGFDFSPVQSEAASPLQGKSVCITGALSEKRSVVEGKIRALGGKVVGSVSKNTDFLLTNDANSGSSKAKKARDLNITIIDELELDKMAKKSL